MSLRLRVMQRDGWPRPIPPRRGPWLWDCMPDTILHLPVCDNQTTTTTTTSSHQTSQIDAAHWCAVRQIHVLGNTQPTHKEWWVRDSAWNGGNAHIHTRTHTPTRINICAHQFLKRITQSSAKRWAFFLTVVPSFSPALLPSLCLYSHPWHVMIKWVLLEFSSWPGLQEAAIPSHPPSSNLHSFITSSLHHPSITLHPFLHQQIPTISLLPGTDSFRIIHLYVNNRPPTSLRNSPCWSPVR